MNPKRLAQALNTIAMGFAEAAEALNDSPGVGIPGVVGREAATSPGGSPAPSFDELPPLDEAQPSFADESVDFAAVTAAARGLDLKEGSLEQCPKHRRPYKAGRYGPFCTSTSDDPKWSNDKGYCTITPKSAAAWLRQQAAVTA